MARQSNFIIGIAVSFVTIGLMLVCVPRCSSRGRLIAGDPLSLSHERDIREMAVALLEDTMRGGDTSLSTLNKLELLMTRLRDGWNGFTVDAYYPHAYSPHHLLDEIYWEVCKGITTPNSPNRAALMDLLRTTRPTDGGDREQRFQEILRYHGLETLR